MMLQPFENLAIVTEEAEKNDKLYSFLVMVFKVRSENSKFWQKG